MKISVLYLKDKDPVIRGVRCQQSQEFYVNDKKKKWICLDDDS